MKIFKYIISIVLVLVVLGLLWKIFKNNEPNKQSDVVVNLKPMNISSSAFLDNGLIPKKYSCDGEGINPPLEFSNLPSKAVSLALTVTDPDAPNGMWVHWLVWNMATSTTEIAENSVPTGAVQGQGSSGQKVYGGPCPPSGTHHYIFTLYALDQKLSIPSYSVLDDLNKAMEGHIVDKAKIIGLYSRN